jgi:hypothetical protein
MNSIEIQECDSLSVGGCSACSASQGKVKLNTNVLKITLGSQIEIRLCQNCANDLVRGMDKYGIK